MKGVMIQGTASDVGKSYITTAICRILSNKGVKVSPYKSQNMSNNSYVTIDGKEIGRAQGVQAEAARALPSAFMNPILLKPKKDSESEIILMGDVYKSLPGLKYHKEFTMTKGIEVVKQTLKHIEENFEAIVIEGAGSPAEVNLNSKEIVNMRVAELANVPVILVADIDRGGSFASLVGTIELTFEHKHRIKGVIFNKFRGDIRLLEDGLKWFEEYTGIPVLGVVPYLSDVYVEVEDAQSDLLKNAFSVDKPLDVAVIHMERVSNNTDVEPFIHESDVSIRIVKDSSEFGNPDAVIIPGTKSTIGDLRVLKEKGLDKAIINYAKNGGNIFGVCGGYQVLGNSLKDPIAVDNNTHDIEQGLGLLNVETTFYANKKVRQISGVTNSNIAVSGYEIHLGQTNIIDDSKPFAKLSDGTFDGCISNIYNIQATYLHNIFHNDIFRNEWLNKIRKAKGQNVRPVVDTTKIKEDSYEKLAKIVEENINMELLMNLVEGR